MPVAGRKSPLEPGTPPNGVLRWTRTWYEKVLNAYRECEGPGMHSAVARRVGADARSVRDMYLRGWADRGGQEWAIPIKDRLEMEKAQARALTDPDDPVSCLFLDVADMADQARRNALRVRVEEGRMVAFMRDQVLSFMRRLEGLEERTDRLMDLLVTRLETESGNMSIKSLMSYLERITKLVREAGGLADLTMRLERLRMGRPEVVVGTVDMTVEEAREEIEAALADVKMVKVLCAHGVPVNEDCEECDGGVR